MSTTIHSLIIEPGVTMTYVCVDGLSSLSRYHVGELLNFNGNLKAINCGVGEEWVTLDQADHDMEARFLNAPDADGDAKYDYYVSMNEN